MEVNRIYFFGKAYRNPIGLPRKPIGKRKNEDPKPTNLRLAKMGKIDSMGKKLEQKMGKTLVKDPKMAKIDSTWTLLLRLYFLTHRPSFARRRHRATRGKLLVNSAWEGGSSSLGKDAELTFSRTQRNAKGEKEKLHKLKNPQQKPNNHNYFKFL